MRRKRQTSTACPNCGYLVYTNARANTRGALINITPAPRDEWTTRAVHIPRQHAIDAAAFGGGIMALVAYGVCAWQHVDAPLPAVIVAGGISALLSFGAVRAMATIDDNRLRWAVETALGVDLDGDGHTGEPDPIKAPLDDPLDGPAPSVLVDNRKPGDKYPHWKSYNVPWGSYREARNVARAVMRWGQPFTRRALVHVKAIPADAGYYSPIYNAMLENGFLAKGSSAPTDKGKRYLTALLSPTPAGDGKE